jgi:hypothetical protein
MVPFERLVRVVGRNSGLLDNASAGRLSTPSHDLICSTERYFETDLAV